LGGRDRRTTSLRAAPGKSKTLSEKQTKAKRAGSMDQEVELLPNKCNTLSSNPITNKVKREKERK
jgi:hypothetical protein